MNCGTAVGALTEADGARYGHRGVESSWPLVGAPEKGSN